MIYCIVKEPFYNTIARNLLPSIEWCTAVNSGTVICVQTWKCNSKVSTSILSTQYKPGDGGGAEGLEREDGGLKREDGGLKREDGRLEREDGGLEREDGGLEREDGELERKDGGLERNG